MPLRRDMSYSHPYQGNPGRVLWLYWLSCASVGTWPHQTLVTNPALLAVVQDLALLIPIL